MGRQINNIFISTGTAKGSALSNADTLYQREFLNVELSGGNFDENWQNRAEMLKSRGARFALHNYYPPPEEPFVLNLGHWDNAVRDLSIKLAIQGLRYSRAIGSDRYAVHAPFAVDLKANQLGKKIPRHQVQPKELVAEIFLESILVLRLEAEKLGVHLYMENSPLSLANMDSLGREAILGVTSQQIIALAEKSNVGVLTDFGHIKVSAHSLGLDPVKEAETMLENSDYIHLSDNNGLEDQHQNFEEAVWFLPILRKHKEKIRMVTLEVGISNLESVRHSKALVQEALS